MILIQFYRLLFISIFASFISCGIARQSLRPEAYQQWYNSDAFVWKNSDTINRLVYAFRYFPNEVSAANCLIKQCKPKDELKSELKESEDVFTFLFEIKSIDWNENIYELARRELTTTEIGTYLNGQIKSDLKAVSSSNDTIDCVGIIYEPISSNKIRLLVSFDAKETIREIVFYDRIFSGYNQHYTIPELSKTTTPSLKF